MSRYDTRGAAAMLLGGFSQGADVARSVQQQQLARESMAQRQGEFEAENARQNMRLQMEQDAIGRDLASQQATADTFAGMGANDFSSLMGRGGVMQLQPDPDPANTTERAKRDLRAVLSTMPSGDQARFIATLSANRQQFEQTAQGRNVKRLVEDYKLKNSKMLSADPELAAQVDMYIATAEFDPRSTLDNFDKLSESIRVLRQTDAMRAGMGPGDYAGLDMQDLQGIQTNRIKLADTNAAMQQGIQMGVRRDPTKSLADGAAQFDGEAVRAQLLANGIDEATADQMVRFAAAKSIAGMPGSVSAPILNPAQRAPGYVRDIVNIELDAANLEVSQLENEYKGLNLGSMAPPTPAEREKAIAGDEAAGTKVDAWNRMSASRSIRKSVMNNAKQSLTPAVRPVAPVEPGPTDASTVQPRGGKSPVVDEPTDDEIRAAAMALPDNATEADILAWITTNRRR